MENFENTEIAFKIKTDSELKWAYRLFKLISYKFPVKFGNALIPAAIRIGLPMNWLIKPTVYRQFCGGESLDECKGVIEKLGSQNVKSILDYSVEGKEDDADIEIALNETLKSIQFGGQNPNVPFAVFKPTAFIKCDALDELSNKSEPGATALREGEKFRIRVDKLCKASFLLGQPILIDAEETYYQSFIDKIVLKMMQKYNREKAIVYNTYQMYRYDRLQKLKEDHRKAISENFFLGAKFVRGAYMERERERARIMGYKDPIHKIRLQQIKIIMKL